MDQTPAHDNYNPDLLRLMDRAFEAVIEQDPDNNSGQMYLRIAAARATTTSVPPPSDAGESAKDDDSGKAEDSKKEP